MSDWEAWLESLLNGPRLLVKASESKTAAGQMSLFGAPAPKPKPAAKPAPKPHRGGPFIGPRGGKWADPQHTIPWKEGEPKKPSKILVVRKVKDPKTGAVIEVPLGSVVPKPEAPKPEAPKPEAPKPVDKPAAPAKPVPKPKKKGKPKLTVKAKPKERQFEDWGEHVPGSRKELAQERAKLAAVASEELEKNPGWARKMVTRNNVIGIWGEDQAVQDKKNGLSPATSWMKREVLNSIQHKPGDSAEDRDNYRKACKVVVESLGRCKTINDVWTMLDEWRESVRGERGDATTNTDYTMVLGRRFADIVGTRLSKGRYGEHLGVYYAGIRSKGQKKMKREMEAITDWDFVKPKGKKAKGAKLGVEKTNEGVVFWSRKIGSVERKGLPEVGNPGDSDQFGKAVGFRGVQYGKWADDADREWHVTNAYWGLHDLASVLGIPAEQLGINGRLALAFGARGKGGRSAAAAHYEPAQRVINLTKMRGNGTLAHEFGHFVDHALFMQENPTVGKTQWASEKGANVYQDIASAMDDVMQAVKFDKETDPKKRATERVRLRNKLDEIKDDLKRGNAELKEIQRTRGRIYQRTGNEIGWDSDKWPADIREKISDLDGAISRTMAKYNENVTAHNETLHDWKSMWGPAETSFYKSAKGLDDTQKRKKPYWGTDLELFARMFESYVEDKLAEKGARSSYLVDGTRADYKAFPGMYVPVDSDHRKAVNVAMDKLIDVMRRHDGFTKSLEAAFGG